MCSYPMVGTSQQGDRWWLELMVDSATMSKTRTCRNRADRSTLIKANSPPSYVAAERGTSDKTAATRFSQCAHDQRRRLEAEDCDSIRCAQLISDGRRRIHPPYCLAHARPTMCCIRLVCMCRNSVQKITEHLLS